MSGGVGRRVVRFGPYDVSLHTGELRKHGLKVRLQDLPFRILALLLEHPGEMVTREELREKLWSADTFVEFEHSVNTAISRLRTALGDSAEMPRYIETLPRRGYRFIGTVKVVEESVPA
ncbi:MAG: CadC family transcriptional regulator, partial [bacterium]|nr:CadC family transcriptional regulator [bacterium]